MPTKVLTRLLATLMVLAAVMVGPTVPRAFAAETVGSYAVEGSISADGSLAVTATITFEGAPPAQLVQRFANTRQLLGDREYVYQLRDVKATVAGQPINATVTQEGGATVVAMPTAGITAPVVLSYVAIGAATAEPTGETTVSWRLLQGLSVPVRTFTATLKAPSVPVLVGCNAGAPTSPGVCTFWGGGTHDYPDPTFNDGPRGSGEVVEAVIRFPNGAITPNEQIRQLWTLGRAFSAEPLPLTLALLALLLGGAGFWLAHRRIGRDASTGEQTPVADFHPIAEGQAEFRVLNGVRPGQVGTLVDERVDPVDVTATLVDLAVRGHLRFTELEHSSNYAQGEWTLTRLDGDDELRPYERTLLDAVAPAEGGDPVEIAKLPGAIGPVIGKVQDQLYDDVVQLGWFAQRPDETRSSWMRIGLIFFGAAVIATMLLAAFTTFGLLGLALIAVALLIVFLGQEMPARTSKGVGLLNGLGLLRAQLLGHPTDQMPKGRELHELSEVLPYAVVLGGYERWLQALVATDTDSEADSTDLNWYHGPADWQLSDLPASLDRLITTIQGKLFSR